MYRLAFTLIMAVAPGLSGCQGLPFNAGAHAAGQAPASPTQAAAAQAGLATFAKLVTPQNCRELGLESADDVRRATLGQAIPLFFVRLDALRSYDGQGNPETLLIDTGSSLYPIEVNRQVATSLLVVKAADGWRATSFGQASLARAAAQARPGMADFLVHVPALQIYLLGTRVDGTLMLTSIIGPRDAEIQTGKPLPAALVFKRLQALAQNNNGLPQ